MLKKLVSIFGLVFILSACQGYFQTQEVRAPVKLNQQEILTRLAPKGVLKVGLYEGSPTSFLRGRTEKDHRGLGYELGAQLAKELGVSYEPVIYSKNADVFEGMKKGEVQVLFTNATPDRAQQFEFTNYFLRVEQSYLTRPGSSIKGISDIDQPDIKIGVSIGSTSQKFLSKTLKEARVLPIKSLAEAEVQLRQGEIDAFATNKSILFELSDKLPNSKVLEGAWGYEQFSAGVVKDNKGTIDYLNAFVKKQIESGFVANLIKRSGIRGAI